MRIKTERLLLRKWTLNDAGAWVKITRQKEVIKWIAGVKYNSSMEEARKLMETDEEKDTAVYFAIVEKESDEVIGSVWLRKIDEEHEKKIAELGILLRKEFWSKGYAAEAYKAMIKFSFDKLKLRKLYVEVNEENLSSRKLHEKLYFTHEGTLRKEAKIRFQNKWCDKLYYGLLKEEFRQ